MKIPRLTSISSFLGLTRNVRIYPAVNHRFPGKSLTVHKDPAELSALKYARIHAVGNASSQCSVANSSPFIPRVSERIIAHRKSLNYKIWQAILRKDWNEWEELLSEYKKHNLPRDEVSYTLQMFGFLFSHRHSSENAYLVVDEMKQASLESSIVDLNEGLLNALFELQGIYCNGPTVCWQNLCRLSWQSTIRLQRRRRKRLREYLTSLPPNQSLMLGIKEVPQIVSNIFKEKC